MPENKPYTTEPPWITDPEYPKDQIKCSCPKCGNFWCRDYPPEIGISPVCQLCSFPKPWAIKNPKYQEPENA